MSARQRTLLILALSAIWPAWAVIRTFIWHPALANEIGDVCAVATAALAATVALYPQKLPTLRDWRRWKADSVLRAHFSALRDEVGTLNARLCHHEDETAGRLNELQALVGAWEEGIGRVFAVAGQPVPSFVSADAPTQPIYLRDRRKAI